MGGYRLQRAESSIFKRDGTHQIEWLIGREIADSNVHRVAPFSGILDIVLYQRLIPIIHLPELGFVSIAVRVVLHRIDGRLLGFRSCLDQFLGTRLVSRPVNIAIIKELLAGIVHLLHLTEIVVHLATGERTGICLGIHRHIFAATRGRAHRCACVVTKRFTHNIASVTVGQGVVTHNIKPAASIQQIVHGKVMTTVHVIGIHTICRHISLLE